MVGFYDGVQRHSGENFQLAGDGLLRFLWDVAHIGFARRNGREPLVGQLSYLRQGYRPGNDQHSVVGAIVFKEKILHVVERGAFDVFDFLADGRPAVGVRRVHQRPQFQPQIAVRLVEVALLELLDDDFPLHFQHIRVEGKAQHSVGFQPKSRFDVVGRERKVVVGNVGRGEGVVLATYGLHRFVVHGNMLRAAEHQVFKKVGKAGALLVLVARTDVVQNIDGGHRR